MRTKWLAHHRRLVLTLLNKTTPGPSPYIDETVDDMPEAAFDALGLRAQPPQVLIILNDPADQARFGGLRHILAPLPELSNLPVHPEQVLVTENKEAALVVPNQAGLVVVAALGNHLNALNALADLTWIDSTEAVQYWGDLDRAGITLLSRARAIIPSLRSVLMDPDTLRRYQHLAVPERKAGISEPWTP